MYSAGHQHQGQNPNNTLQNAINGTENEYIDIYMYIYIYILSRTKVLFEFFVCSGMWLIVVCSTNK